MNKIVGKATFFFALLLCSAIVLGQSKPNIIFILADDLGYGELQAYGSKETQTPNIDKLAESGILFTNAYANSNVCSPSRASILTGNHPDHVGVPGVIRDNPDNTWGKLKEDAVTLPQVLQQNDYKTALIGKWHLGYSSPNLPNDRGFDFFKGFLGDMMDDYYTHQRNGINWMRHNKDEILTEGVHATELFTNWAIDYVEENATANDPFYLFLSYNAPHDPIQPPKEFVNKVKSRAPHLTDKRQDMVAFVEHLDENVGKLLQKLDYLGVLDNTLVVFTSDNGGALQYGASNYPLSGGKGDMYEGGIRIPCIVKLPFQKKYQENDEVIQLMDFYPTFISIAGGEWDASLPSRPISTIISAEKDTTRELIWVRREGFKFGGQAFYAIFDGRYKLAQQNPFSAYQLFDLLKDPNENTPLEFPEKYAELKKKLTKHIQQSGQIPWQ